MDLSGVLILLILQFTSKVAAKANGCAASCSSDISNGPKFNLQRVNVHADMGFYAFSFGASHTFAYQNFVMNLKKPVWLSVTDCYCPGDRFQVFDMGKPIMVTSECPEQTPSCELAFDNNAWSCLNNDNFCKGVALLDVGHHNLTVAVINSSLGGGAAFLRLDTICPQHSNPYNPTNPPPACCMYNPYSDFTDYPVLPGRLCNQMVQYPN